MFVCGSDIAAQTIQPQESFIREMFKELATTPPSVEQSVPPVHQFTRKLDIPPASADSRVGAELCPTGYWQAVPGFTA